MTWTQGGQIGLVFAAHFGIMMLGQGLSMLLLRVLGWKVYPKSQYASARMRDTYAMLDDRGVTIVSGIALLVALGVFLWTGGADLIAGVFMILLFSALVWFRSGHPIRGGWIELLTILLFSALAGALSWEVFLGDHTVHVQLGLVLGATSAIGALVLLSRGRIEKKRFEHAVVMGGVWLGLLLLSWLVYAGHHDPGPPSWEAAIAIVGGVYTLLVEILLRLFGILSDA